MVSIELENYIKECLGQGIAKEEIRKTLLASGWQGSDIEDGFREIGEVASSSTPSLNTHPAFTVVPIKFNKKKKIFLLAGVAIVLLVIGGGIYWWQGMRVTEITSEVLREKLSAIKTAHFTTKSIKDLRLESSKESAAGKLLVELNLLDREGDIALPNSFYYKLGVASPLPKDKKERDKVLSELELGGMLLTQQGAEYIGIGDKIFTRVDLNILKEVGVLDESQTNESQLDQLSAWRDMTGAGIEEIALPIESFYLKNIVGLASDVTKAGKDKFVGKINMDSMAKAYWDVQEAIRLSDPLTKNKQNSESYIANSSTLKVVENYYSNSQIVISLSKKGEIESIVFDIKEPKGSTSTEKTYFPGQQIEFTKINSPVDVKAPEVTGVNTKESRDAFNRDYTRRSSAIYISDGVGGLYKGFNSFPISEKEVNLDDFKNPIVANLINKLSLSRTGQTGRDQGEANGFWQMELTDPLPGKYHYTYQSINSGDSFIVSYFQETNQGPENYRANEKRTCDNSGCKVDITVTGKYIRDTIRKNRIARIAEELAVLHANYPTLKEARFGTIEVNAVMALINNNPQTMENLSSTFKMVADQPGNIYFPKNLSELISDPLSTKRYLTYSSVDGKTFSIKAELENSPDENNQQELLGNFCEGIFYKMYCSEINGKWYLIQENTIPR